MDYIAISDRANHSISELAGHIEIRVALEPKRDRVGWSDGESSLQQHRLEPAGVVPTVRLCHINVSVLMQYSIHTAALAVSHAELDRQSSSRVPVTDN